MKSSPKNQGGDVHQDAAEWLVAIDSGLTAAQHRQFEEWIRADPKHEAALQHVGQTWARLRALRLEREKNPVPALAPATGIPRPGRTARVGWLAIAAAAVLAIGGLAWQIPTTRSVGTSHHVGPASGYTHLSLADGSLVDLRSGGELTVQFTGRERRVHLVRGEAHFTVAQNRESPFIVDAGPVGVRAIGTAFNVRRTSAAVEVLVTAGTVKLDPATGDASAPDLSAPMTSGWHAVVPAEAPGKIARQHVSPARVREILAWQSARLTFVDLPLGEVIEQFNQRSELKVILADEALARTPVGGSFSADNVEGFIRLLTSSGELVARRPSADRIVLERAE